MKFSATLLLTVFAFASGKHDGTLEDRLEENHSRFLENKEAAIDVIKGHNERRMAKLEEMIQERRQLKEDHEAGRRRLSDDEYDRANRQYRNFQRKLEQLKKRSSDEQHFERLEDLRALHAMNRVDYVDVKEELVHN